MKSSRPKAFYKYYPPERTDVLENGKLSFSPPSRFNDPFDFNPAVTIPCDDASIERSFNRCIDKVPVSQPNVTLEGWKEYIKANAGRMEDDAQRDLASMLNSFDRGVGVYCVTEHECDLFMWSHYASEHRGFVVEFDAAHEFFVRRMGPANYSHERPVHTQADGPKELEKIAMTKSSHWIGEKEWRSLNQLKDCERRMINPPCGVEFPIYEVPFPKESVLRVICGGRMVPDKVETLRTSLRRWGYACRLVQLDFHPKKFELISTEIPLAD